MSAEVVRTLYGYTAWANGKILDAVRELTPEELDAPGTAGHGSIRETLVHMFRAHQGWLSWWDGSLPPEEAYRLRMEAADFVDAVALRAKWDEIARQTAAFVEVLTDEGAARSMPMQGGVEVPLWQLMVHVANHGTQHRSEVAAMLTAMGHSPGGLDLLFYLREQP